MLVNSLNQLDEVIARLMAADWVVVDTETTGLEVWKNDHLCGIGFCFEDETTYYLPYRHSEGISSMPLMAALHSASVNLPLATLPKLLAALKTVPKIIGHKIKFDLTALYRDGFDLDLHQQIEDTKTAARLYFTEKHPDLTLEHLTEVFIGKTTAAYKQNFFALLEKHGWKGRFDKCPPGLIADYCESDCLSTKQVRDYLLEHIARTKQDSVWEHECRLAKVLWKMEQIGLCFDIDYCLDRIPKLEARMHQIEQSVWEMCKGKEFNLGSTDQITEAFASIGIKPISYTTGGKTRKPKPKWSVSELMAVDHPVGGSILEYRGLQKLKTTYFDPLLEYPDGIIHPTLNSDGTVTGRMSCVPEDSEILTAEGWKTREQLTVGESIISYDVLKGKLVWDSVLKINTGLAPVGDLWFKAPKTHLIGVRCTSNHAWVAETYFMRGFIKTNHLPQRVRKNHNLLLSAGQAGAGGSSTVSTVDASILGWLITDGCVLYTTAKRPYFSVGQTKPSGIAKLKKLRKYFDSENTYRKVIANGTSKRTIDCYALGMGVNKAEAFFKRVGWFPGENLVKAALQFNLEARESLLAAMIAGDGSVRPTHKPRRSAKGLGLGKKGGAVSFGAGTFPNQHAKHYVFDLFTALAAVAGFRCAYVKTALKSGMEFNYCSLYQLPTTNAYKFIEGKSKAVPVWCPTTTTGTWIMRQNGQVVITGNSSDPNFQNISKSSQNLAGNDTSEEALEALKAFLGARKGEVVDMKQKGSGGMAGGLNVAGMMSLTETYAEGDLTVAVRRLYIPRDGFHLYFIDFSQMEMRVFADYVGDPELTRLLEDPLFDFHTHVAKEVWKIDESHELWTFYRTLAKAINFGLIYGIGTNKLASQIQKTKEEAEQYKVAYFARFPKAQTFMKRVANTIETRGWIANRFGRRYELPSDKGYVGVNYLVQGTAADIVKLGMINIQDLFEKQKARSRMLSQVHDELIFEIAYDEEGSIVREIKSTAEIRQISTYLPTEVSRGNPSWAQKEKVCVYCLQTAKKNHVCLPTI